MPCGKNRKKHFSHYPYPGVEPSDPKNVRLSGLSGRISEKDQDYESDPRRSKTRSIQRNPSNRMAEPGRNAERFIK